MNTTKKNSNNKKYNILLWFILIVFILCILIWYIASNIIHNSWNSNDFLENILIPILDGVGIVLLITWISINSNKKTEENIDNLQKSIKSIDKSVETIANDGFIEKNNKKDNDHNKSRDEFNI